MSKAKSPRSTQLTEVKEPSTVEILGQLLILETVAASATTRLLRFHDSDEKPQLIRQILDEIDDNCRRKGLRLRDVLDAQEFAKNLICDAQAEADRLDSIKHAHLKRSQH
ncbi:hypothetical protein FHX08_003891 [Rhizobium sp. BK529]|uniref:hypothetical protein n=1 Tax=unclassified Rhizobium TaxID=2613769 RepID=UPI001047DE7B|nr:MULTISPECIES: hypothetical protein [unclassified Rhizobium]MBB3593488.1 hypothetical protein [Rhizobium sp. BK529]TCS03279.1 hypothetical protein EV281_104362 [Rhizobium sp. BK418]